MQKLLLLKLFGYIVKEDRQGAAQLLKSEDVDFVSFNKFAWGNHIAGTMYSILSVSELRTLFPRELLESFKASYLEQWTKNERLLNEISSLSEIFDWAGKDVIFLKGPFLAERFYGNIDRRAISDIDLLVKKEEIDVIDRMLEKNGYLRKSFIFPKRALATYFTHHFEYERNGIELDLHWNLSVHFSFSINYERLWRENKLYEFHGKKYRVLSDEYELVFQILSIFRDMELGTITLKSFLDVYMILKHTGGSTDWDEFFACRRNEGVYKISINILDMALWLLDCRSEYAELAIYIDQNGRLIKARDSDQKLGLLNRSGFSFKNKEWALGLYSTSPLFSFLWWVVSLPFKLPVYRQSSSKLFRRRS